jgi:hypothetical protein
MSNTKSLKSLIAIILTIVIAIPITTLTTTTQAQSRTQSWALIDVSPNPVGVGQKVAVIMFANPTFPNAAVTNDIRRHNYTLTITRPDNQTETMHWRIIEDTGNGQVALYTPTQVGTYSFVFSFPDQIYTWNATAAMRQWTNTIFLGATSKTVDLSPYYSGRFFGEDLPI